MSVEPALISPTPACRSYFPGIQGIQSQVFQNGVCAPLWLASNILTFCFSYNSAVSGPSGNITVNGTLTCTDTTTLTARGLGAGEETGIDLNEPPYAIHNGQLPNHIPLIAAYIEVRQWPPLITHHRHKRNARWGNSRAGCTQHVGSDGGEGFASCSSGNLPWKPPLFDQQVNVSVLWKMVGPLGMPLFY